MGYIYCLPRTGFNDILCEIAVAWDYAERFQRTLVVDTRQSALDDAFGRYFTALEGNPVLDPTPEFLESLNVLSVYPACLQGRIDSHQVEYHGKGLFRENQSGELLTFNPRIPYEEDILVYERARGGPDSIHVLPKLRLLPELAQIIFQALVPLGKNYAALHVRNTDRNADYRSFFKPLFPRLRGRDVLVCSDDPACREFAAAFFVESNVMTATELPQDAQGPLHLQKGDALRKNMAMLTDLAALAFATELHVAPVTSPDAWQGISGFSFLALHLHTNPSLRESFFGG